MRDGRIEWLGTSGFADLRTHAPVTANTLFSLASTTKMFVATTILRLYDLGKLGIDDPIRAYVPTYMPDTQQVTIRNLLGHTSGYRDVEGFPQILRWLADPNHAWSRDQILSRVRPVRFTPGSRFQYCNTNYVILGRVIESASHSNIPAVFERLVADPAGLGDDAVFQRRPAAAPLIAHGYTGRFRLHDTFQGAQKLGIPTGIWGVMWTDGGLAADARGVARFTDALFGGRLLKPATLQMMITPGPNGSYGLGTYHMHFDHHEWQGHDGFYVGFTTLAMYDFSRHVTIVVLTNLTDPSDPAFQIWHALTRAYDALR